MHKGWSNPKERDRLEDQTVDRKIVLRRVLNKIIIIINIIFISFI